MQNITFIALSKSTSPDWGNLVMMVDGKEARWREINLSGWESLSPEMRDEMCFDLITPELEKALLKGEACFNDPSLYQKWYEYEFFVDGEDAREFIELVPRTRHSTLIQPRCGVECGWEYYKRLVAHEFHKRTAANLAYWRGYLAGMDLNSPWDREGTEAIHCMDLELEAGKKFAYDED